MTKVTVFGEQESKAEKKPIEFVWYVSGGSYEGPSWAPSDFDNVMLLGNDAGKDIIMAWDDCHEGSPLIYLGHWNDGVV